MDMHLDSNMTWIRPLDGLKYLEYVTEFGDLVNRDPWKRDKNGSKIA